MDEPKTSKPSEIAIVCTSCGLVWESPMTRSLIEQTGACPGCREPITLPRPDEHERGDR